MKLPDDTMDGGRTLLVDRVLVCYPRTETDEERRARTAKGLPRPTVSFVVSTAVPAAPVIAATTVEPDN